MSGNANLEIIVQALRDSGEVVSAPDNCALPVSGITCDSRRVEPGYLFCAIKGVSDDGHRFIESARERGAVAALVTEPTDVDLPVVRVRHGRLAAAIAAEEWYDWPRVKVDSYAVTGTNGKSTTASVTRDLLNARQNVGLLGTLGLVDGAGNRLPESVPLTTPGPVELQAILRTLADRNTSAVVMEVSSHALDQDRIAGIQFAAAAFTNLTHEHLDYHGTLDEYLTAKLKLADYVEEAGSIVYNVDTPVWRSLAGARPPMQTISYGMVNRADIHARNVVCSVDGTVFDLDVEDESFNVRIPLLGEFNVSNVLAAVGMALAAGEVPEVFVPRLSELSQVKGRMERLRSGKALVLRDYAHTPDAMERVLRAVRRFTAGRLIVLFGCGGDRDRKKRPAMGRAAARNADVVFLTTDNPRSEDPAEIITEIASGIEMAGYITELDRAKAIERAMGMLEPGDTLLLAGKGHETYQMLGDVKHPFDEAQIVREYRGAI